MSELDGSEKEGKKDHLFSFDNPHEVMDAPSVPLARPIKASRNVQGRAGRESILQSSLDIVWSYSRSTAFIGSQLPSSPSFVNHYVMPPSSSRHRPKISGATDESPAEISEASEESDAEAYSITEEDEVDNADERSQWFEESLPPNAILSNKQRRRSSKPVPSQLGQLLHSEATPLLDNQSSDAGSYGTQFEERPASLHEVPFARRAPSFSKSKKDDFESEHSYIGITGESTFTQSLFNSINVLVGVGILAEPLAFSHAGWVLGSLILLFCGFVTCHTAKILAGILRRKSELMTYADIGAAAFGQGARTWISFLFCLELSALSVALIVLFGDSMSTLYPNHSATFFKIIAFFVVTPTLFLPLRLLSVTSLIGIISAVGLIVVVYVDGSLKKTAPGSLVQHAVTSVGPDWKRLPLSFGLIMSGFSGHAVMPSIARDMRSPQQFNAMINLAYVISFVMYLVMAIGGYLMFGNDVSDEVTRDILQTKGYPRTVTRLAVWAIALNPVCKFAIGTRPLHSTIEYILGISKPASQICEVGPSKIDLTSGSDAASTSDPPSTVRKQRSFTQVTSAPSSGLSHVSLAEAPASIRASVGIMVKVLTTACLVLVAIFWPGFESVMSFLGAFSAFVICVHGPIMARLFMYSHEMSPISFWFDIVLLVISTVMCISGTVLSFIPQ